MNNWRLKLITDGQYIRLEALLGEEQLITLQNRRVAVIGCGAVGSFTLEPLARCGIMDITVVDFDKFELSNLNRQLLATHQSIGRVKVEVAKERILSINPVCKVTALNTFVDKNNVEEIIKGMDVVFDCIDSVTSKCELLKACIDNNIKVFSSMGAALKTDITKIQVTDIWKTTGCPLAKAVRTQLKKLGVHSSIEVVFSPELPNRENCPTSTMLGSMPTITATFGLTLAHKGLEYLLAKGK